MADLTTREASKKKVNGFFITVTALMTVIAKRASRLPLKLKAAPTREDRKTEIKSPKKLLKNISFKTLPFIANMRNKSKKKRHGKEEWGDGGLWQKTILMGDKCEPLDFSGVIYYDNNGKQVNGLPIRSPRASPAPGFFIQPKLP